MASGRTTLDEHTTGRITARPALRRRTARREPGVHPLGLGIARDALLFVPALDDPTTRPPLLVMLHGAGGEARGALDLVRSAADAVGALILAPESRGPTWDVIRGELGPDVAFIDACLSAAFEQHDVDGARIALGGFSDGASYALTIGPANGDLFDALLAFSPGFAAPPARRDDPRIFVSHGTRDAVLPIARCSRVLVPRLQRAGFSVRYDEFDGPHAVPGAIARAAVEWWLAPAPPA